MEEGRKIIAENRKARFNYTITETIECGIELQGTEVKSFSSIFNHDPDRKKKLLLHRDEIKRLKRKVDEKGVTLVPLDFYLKKGLVKVTLGLCKGKKLFDKRADIKDRDVKRDMEREFRNRLDG